MPQEKKEEEKVEKVNFRTHALIKSILGKDLITDDNIAVLELVKNSFDANSKSVDISFFNLKNNSDDDIDSNLNISDVKFSKAIKESSSLVISDKGHGMNYSGVVDKWLNIAYSDKKGKQTEFGRALAGNKGVGRLSCDRLGAFLNLYTTTTKSNEVIHLRINWNNFDVSRKVDFEIQNVKINLQRIPKNEFTKETGLSSFNHGTLLVISKLRSKWSYDKLIKLKQNLEKLLNPNQAFKANKFEVYLWAEEFLKEDKKKKEGSKVNGLVENKVFKELGFKTSNILSKITKDFIITILKDKGKVVFTLVEKNSNYSELNNIKINLYYLGFYPKVYFKKNTGVRSVDFGSVFLFINGFRIPPYGDNGNDWLGIEKRKGQGHSRFLGAREILGHVVIEDPKSNFQIISSRSGVVQDESFDQLINESTGYYMKTHRRLEKFVEGALKWDSVPYARKEQGEIEKKILKGNSWTEKDEVYTEENSEKERRFLSIILNIINTKKGDILKLSINKDIVSEILQSEANKIEQELEKTIQKFKEQNITSEQVSIVIDRLKDRHSELVKSFKNLRSASEDIESLEKIAAFGEGYSKEQDIVFERFEKLHSETDKLQQEKRKLEEQLALEKEKNTYLSASSQGVSKDAQGLIHNIKITSGRIITNVDLLIGKVHTEKLTTKELLKRLETIKFNADKALKISKLITRANFKTNAEKQVFDIPKFIDQYISIYSDIYEQNQLKFNLEIKEGTNFSSKKSILDLSVIFDNLISNSSKASAKEVNVFVEKVNNMLLITFSDDGNGLDSKFNENKDAIFELGITTTDGSGIGLFSARSTLKKMHGKIDFLGNGVVLKGAAFLITFSK